MSTVARSEDYWIDGETTNQQLYLNTQERYVSLISSVSLVFKLSYIPPNKLFSNLSNHITHISNLTKFISSINSVSPASSIQTVMSVSQFSPFSQF